jgi:hypothetical protein
MITSCQIRERTKIDGYFGRRILGFSGNCRIETIGNEMTTTLRTFKHENISRNQPPALPAASLVFEMREPVVAFNALLMLQLINHYYMNFLADRHSPIV